MVLSPYGSCSLLLDFKMSADSQVVKVVLMTMKTAHFLFVCFITSISQWQEKCLLVLILSAVCSHYSHASLLKKLVVLFLNGRDTAIAGFKNKGFTVCHKRMCLTFGEREVRVLTRQTEVTSEAWLLLKHALRVLFIFLPGVKLFFPATSMDATSQVWK